MATRTLRRFFIWLRSATFGLFLEAGTAPASVSIGRTDNGGSKGRDHRHGHNLVMQFWVRFPTAIGAITIQVITRSHVANFTIGFVLCLFLSRLARPDCDQSGESGLPSDRLTTSLAGSTHSNLSARPPHAPRRGDWSKPARPLLSSALAQPHRRGGGLASRPASSESELPRSQRRHSSTIRMRHVRPPLADSSGICS
jgi:hypothetical protein